MRRHVTRVAEIAATLLVVAGSVGVAALPQESSGPPTLDQVLESAGEYIAAYETAISAVIAREDYQQLVQGALGSMSRYAVTAPATRKTVADLLVLDAGAAGWVAFRDVYEVDGRAVRDHDERLASLFADFRPDSIDRARRIADESARFNLNAGALAVNRTINTPMTALLFLRTTNQSRSEFRLDKADRIDGVPCVVVRFEEQTSPRLIGTREGSPAQGTFWIEPVTGRVMRTELELRVTRGRRSEQFVAAKLRVEFKEVPGLDLWLPRQMDESYELRPGTQVITGRAEYSDFRQFEVSTDVEVR